METEKTRGSVRQDRYYYRTRTTWDSVGTPEPWKYYFDEIRNATDEHTAIAEWHRPKPDYPTATDLLATHSSLYWNMPTTSRYYRTRLPGCWYERDYLGPQDRVMKAVGEDTGPLVKTRYPAPAGGDTWTLGRAAARFTGSRANLGESLGELRETSWTVVKRARQAYSILKRLRSPKSIDSMVKAGMIDRRMGDRLKSIAPWKSTKRLSEAYLEVSFMWVPLFQDIYNVLDYRHSKLKQGDTVRSQSFLGDRNSHWRAGYYGRVTNETLANLNAYGLANPGQTAWQLTSLSFVADWLLNVSAVLGQLTAFVGFTMTSGWKLSMTSTVERYTIAGERSRVVTIDRQTVLPVTGVYFSTALTKDGRAFAGQLVTLAALFRVGRFR